MLKKGQPLSIRVNSATGPASLRNSIFAIGFPLAFGPTLKIWPWQRKRTVAQQQDSGRDGANGLAKLTRREKDVMRLLAHGLLYKEIAGKLGISYSAVHKHQHNIFKKFG